MKSEGGEKRRGCFFVRNRWTRKGSNGGTRPYTINHVRCFSHLHLHTFLHRCHESGSNIFATMSHPHVCSHPHRETKSHPTVSHSSHTADTQQTHSSIPPHPSHLTTPHPTLCRRDAPRRSVSTLATRPAACRIFSSSTSACDEWLLPVELARALPRPMPWNDPDEGELQMSSSYLKEYIDVKV